MAELAHARELSGDLTTEYPRFEDVMNKWGYDWEAHQVQTDDDYILTTFRVLGKTGEASQADSKGSVLIQHGGYQDGADWLSTFETGKPFHLQLVDYGYDVWIGNNRGSEYSRGHNKYDATTDNDYWMFTFTEMGLYDTPANISMIKD